MNEINIKRTYSSDANSKAALSFRKVKVALNPMYRIFCQKLHPILLIKILQ